METIHPLNPYDHLCWYDTRRTDYEADNAYIDFEDRGKRHKSCSCDSCFYGRDMLAQEIIKLMEKKNGF